MTDFNKEKGVGTEACSVQEEAELPNLPCLPKEVLSDILKRLSPGSLIRCSLVCKKWRSLILNNALHSKRCHPFFIAWNPLSGKKEDAEPFLIPIPIPLPPESPQRKDGVIGKMNVHWGFGWLDNPHRRRLVFSKLWVAAPRNVKDLTTADPFEQRLRR